MSRLPESRQIAEQQLKQIADWHQAEPELAEGELDLSAWMTRLHALNFTIWHLEDLARDTHATDSSIAGVKRKIDRANQLRNDAMEKVDEKVLAILEGHSMRRGSDATLHSETPGALTDRLSVNGLKLYHMKEQVERNDVAPEHRAKCQARVELLSEQRQDLTQCLGALFTGLQSGKLFFKVYRQVKMYNDPSLNPVLYGANQK